MIKKSWLIVALLVMLVFCVGCVSANDDVDEVVNIGTDVETVDASIDDVDTNDLEASESNTQLNSVEQVNARSWTKLEQYCEETGTDYNISLTGTSYNANSQIVFGNSATIIGTDSSYITGGTSSETTFLNTNSAYSITFLNVHFRDMSVENLIKLCGNSRIENCTFSNIVASTNNNNVIWNTNDYMTIVGCNFTSCTVGKGVVSNYDPSGSTSVQMIINNSNFNNNYARSYAGAINNRAILNVYNSNFINNSASSWAGAINGVQNSETYIFNSKFKNNVAGWNGGAIYTYSLLEIYNSAFEGNNCTTNNGGGAIGAYNFISTYNITVENCNFTNNINLCKAFDNLSTTSLGRGGAISVLNGGYLDVHNSRFVNNYARIGQAIAAATYSYVNASGGNPHISIYNNNFTNHTGSNDTVYITGTDIVFNNNRFKNSVQTIQYSGSENNYNYLMNIILEDNQEILGVSARVCPIIDFLI